MSSAAVVVVTSPVIGLSALAGVAIGYGIAKIAGTVLDSIVQKALNLGNYDSCEPFSEFNYEMFKIIKDNVFSEFEEKLNNNSEIEQKVNKLKNDFFQLESEYKQKVFENESSMSDFRIKLSNLESDAMALKFELESIKIEETIRKKIKTTKKQQTRKNKKVDISFLNEETFSDINSKSQIINAINEYLDMIKELDVEFFKELEHFKKEITREDISDKRLELIKNEAMLKYGNIKDMMSKDAVYRETLLGLKKEILSFSKNEKDILEIDNIMKEKYINQVLFEPVLKIATKRINKYLTNLIERKEKDVLIRNLSLALETQGYNIVNDEYDFIAEQLHNGEIVYIDTDDNEYKIMLKISENGNVAMRFVRFVGTEVDKKNVSSYQKNKDLEKASKWCSKLDNILNHLNKKGLTTDVTLRREPNEEDVMYIVNSKIKSTKVIETRIDNERKLDSE